MATGDFNRDGIVDLVVVNECGTAPDCLSDGSVSILLGKPDGTFQSAVDYRTQSEPTFVLVADFNEDSNPDIAVTNVGSNTISILIGNGDGSFSSAANYDTEAAPVSADAGDFNGDGHLDLAVARMQVVNPCPFCAAGATVRFGRTWTMRQTSPRNLWQPLI